MHLKQIGIDPYYIFNTKGKEETGSYRVPIARFMQALNEIRLLPGTERPNRGVFNLPGIGKVNLADRKSRRVIAILPNGSRVYRFIHWAHRLFANDKYAYTDVSIYDYIKELKRRGESLSDYKSIWYYY